MDQSEIAQFCLANELLDQIFKTYSALSKVQKIEGQNIAKQILETCTGPFKELFAAITAYGERVPDCELGSEVGLKILFVESLLLGCFVVPALDALCCRFRQVIPSFKKKKGALPPDVDQLQKTIFNGLKSAIKELSAIIEKIPTAVETSVSEKYNLDVLTASCDKIDYFEGTELA